MKPIYHGKTCAIEGCTNLAFANWKCVYHYHVDYVKRPEVIIKRKGYQEKYKQTTGHYERHRESNKRTNQKARREALQHYGGTPPKCACCGETEYQFLAIDHINGGGNQSRKINNGVGSAIYRKLRSEGYPAGLQVLCHNCNLAKGFYGICPHQLKKDDENAEVS